MPRRSRFPEHDTAYVTRQRSDHRADYDAWDGGSYAAGGAADPDMTMDYGRLHGGSTHYGESSRERAQHHPSNRRSAAGRASGIQPTEDDGSEELPVGRKQSRGKRIALISALVLSLLVGAGAIGAGLYLRSVEKGIARVDAFAGISEEGRPDKVSGSINYLILGSDSRDPEVTGSRTDSIMLTHIPADRSSAQLISIPRDTWVHVPRSQDGRKGGQDAKINAAFSWGGIPLMVQTVESFTGVRVDHVVLIDFAGFVQIINALGGVDIVVSKTFTSIHKPYRVFRKGTQHMDGETALDFSRQRKQFADGDFTRIRHQQQVIKAVMDKAVSAGILANPTQLNAFVRATANAVAVDQTLDLLGTAMDLRHLRSNNLAFMTSPTRGTGKVGNQSVVFADTETSKAFYDAVRRDAVAEFTSMVKK